MMPKDLISYHISQALKRAKISIFYLEGGMISEASKEAQKSWRHIMATFLVLSLYQSSKEPPKYRSVPKSKIFSVSKSLQDKGYEDLVKLSALYYALTNEIPNSEKKILILTLIEEELIHVKKWFRELWNEDYEKELNNILEELKKISK